MPQHWPNQFSILKALEPPASITCSMLASVSSPSVSRRLAHVRFDMMRMSSTSRIAGSNVLVAFITVVPTDFACIGALDNSLALTWSETLPAC
jgi:hypothetical protein